MLRRDNLLLNTEAEIAIKRAIKEVSDMEYHDSIERAIGLMSKALEIVSARVDKTIDIEYLIEEY